MRLTEQQQGIIKQTFLEIFGDGNVYLFGSRVDDYQKGGDIDLYLRLRNNNETSQERYRKKIKFLVLLEQKLGEQKIDVIISKDLNTPIEQEALRTGIKL